MNVVKVVQPSGQTALYISGACVEMSDDKNYIDRKWNELKITYPGIKRKEVFLNSEMEWKTVRENFSHFFQI